MPNPGKYDQRGTIQRPGTRTNLPGGGYTEGTATTVATGVWARVEGLRSFERIRAMQTDADPTHRIELPYRAGLDEKMQFAVGDRVLKFTGPPVDEKGDRAELVVLAREV